MTDLTKLRELQERASPGPWKQQLELDYDTGKETEFPIVLAAPGTAMGGHCLQIIGGFRDEPEMALADAKLAALTPHLLPLAEALETITSYSLTNSPNITRAVDEGRKALKNLQEALKRAD